MCVPIAVAAAAISAAGSLVSGVQGMMQGQYEARVARQNAALDTERARDSIEQGRDEAQSFYRELAALKGQQIASMAANGIDVGEGTALLFEDDTVRAARDDVSRLYRNVHERTRGFDISRANNIAEARAAKERGKSALTGSLFEAGSSLMGGFQQHRAMQARLGIGKGSSTYLGRAASRYGGG